jgi:antitoxin component YwqK of YwqJK toxin-antitoxin module
MDDDKVERTFLDELKEEGVEIKEGLNYVIKRSYLYDSIIYFQCKNGKPIGMVKEFYVKNNLLQCLKLEETYSSKGLKNGPSKEYNVRGILISECVYEDGVLIGPEFTYNPLTERLSEVNTYKGNKLDEEVKLKM